MGPTLLRKRNITDSQKWSGSVGAEHPTATATSNEFEGLLTKVAPNTQSLCITAPFNEGSLITSKLEVAKDVSLRALVDCGASTNFVRRQSLYDSKLIYIERGIAPTRMKVRLATGTSVAVNNLVVGVVYTL